MGTVYYLYCPIKRQAIELGKGCWTEVDFALLVHGTIEEVEADLRESLVGGVHGSHPWIPGLAKRLKEWAVRIEPVELVVRGDYIEMPWDADDCGYNWPVLEVYDTPHGKWTLERDKP